MRRLALSLALLALGACAVKENADPAPAAAAETTRRVAGGEVVGFVAPNGAHVWRGVPFAASTAGENRWRAPRPVPEWAGVREALAHSERCPQMTNAFDESEGVEAGMLVGSEDCLALDIYSAPGAGARPVMVWIHGGGNVWGRSGQYDGSNLAANENVVVVAVQYRLGPLGWFAHEALREDAQTPRDESANFGTLDLVAALEWVRDNIAAFGGDPSNVTIFGESAGGHNVASLFGSPLARGLFHRAIMQSGSFDSVGLDVAEGSTAGAVNAAGAIAERLAATEASALRSVSLGDLFAAYGANVRGFLELPTVIEDGVALPAEPLREAVARPGGANPAPLITGVTRDEMKLFQLLDPRFTRRWFGLLITPRDKAFYERSAHYTSRLWRVRAVDDPAAALAKAGRRDIYAYRFDWDEGGRFLFTDLKALLGAGHSMEIPFVFNRFKLLGDADRLMFTKATDSERKTLSRIVGGYWAGFARDGVPYADGAPAWPPYLAEPGAPARIMRLDGDGGPEVIEGEDSLDRLLADLALDAALDPQERCLIASELSAWTPAIADVVAAAVPCGATR